MIRLKPKWSELDKRQLSEYQRVGIIATIIGAVILAIYVPTIKIWFKVLGAIVFGYGINIFRSATRLKKIKIDEE